MIIDCHGHYTTAPKALENFRARQLAGMIDPALRPKVEDLGITDEMLRESVEKAQLKFQRERGTDLTIFSPKAAGMQHHYGDERVSAQWAQVCNDLIYRLTQLYPANFAATCQLPQEPGVSPRNCIPELERCVNELGFVGVNVNPDPSGGWWKDPPLTDRHWYPLYEKLVELDVPMMVHVSSSCNACFHATGAHYINADTTAVMQLIQGDLFKDFPNLRVIVPHGGGAVPYHFGRYRGLALNLKRASLEEHLFQNVFFDTCVYDQRGIDLLTDVIPHDNLLFASEMVGAVKGIDPNTGYYFDDTRRYVDEAKALSEASRKKIYETNALKVFPRLKAALERREKHLEAVAA
ncbi:amidohydrolase family protein [Hydrogenophaga sp. BPS33]|uniref:amidohydrolase family protein n=1 Tax=Hydrogenophaga sp. BPS33 TaxID=2651974 RepID=UPI00131FFFF3|nr:amidohydrolase family protein [Hydrogenophaga sp. BPS33]QHE87534.1 amidohydrolase [Hydrogenophaga sp. BPS33]